jgi:hypothetical protein
MQPKSDRHRALKRRILTRSGHRHFPKNKPKNPNFEVSSPPGAA